MKYVAFRTWSWRCAVVLALGAFGVFLLACSRTAWGARRRARAARCAVCRRHQRWQGSAVLGVAALQLLGTGLFVHQQAVAVEPPSCGAEWFIKGIVPQFGDVEPVAPWRVTRDVVTAPATALAHTYATVRGMRFCKVGQMSVAFPAVGPRVSGTTVGDMFLTRVEPGLSGSGAQALGDHESHHVDQWTVATLAAGPLALPALYTLDETFFPGPRNHFERAAGLASGGYEEPAGFGPDPRWGGVAVLLAVVLLLGQHRLRRLVFRLLPGHPPLLGPPPNRCALHTHTHRLRGG